MLVEAPHMAEPMMKTKMPGNRTFFLPTMSDNRPVAGMTQVEASYSKQGRNGGEQRQRSDNESGKTARSNKWLSLDPSLFIRDV